MLHFNLCERFDFFCLLLYCMQMFSPFCYKKKVILQLRQHRDDTLYSDKIIGNYSKHEYLIPSYAYSYVLLH